MQQKYALHLKCQNTFLIVILLSTTCCDGYNCSYYPPSKTNRNYPPSKTNRNTSVPGSLLTYGRFRPEAVCSYKTRS
jgi:hypothetical protein